jgi:hypothetical protein
MSGAPEKTVVLPAQWPPPPGVRPLVVEAKTTPGNTVAVVTAGRLSKAETHATDATGANVNDFESL